MPRIAKTDFNLNVGADALVQYKAGEAIDKAHEAHWWAQAHSEEQRKLTKAEQKALADAQKAVDDAQAAYDAAAAKSQEDIGDVAAFEAAGAAREKLDAARAALDDLTKD